MTTACIEVKHGSKEYDQTVALRDVILRSPLGLRFSLEELSDEKDSFHLAYRHDNTLAACLVLKPLSHNHVRMRQLAVREECRGMGIGRALVRFSESFAKDHGYEEIVLHARETAVGFYEKEGYNVDGDRFTEVTIPHVPMRKRLVGDGERTP